MSKKKVKNSRVLLLTLSLGLCFLFVSFLVAKAIFESFKPDQQCLIPHTTNTIPPIKFETAKDFFDFGNYNYDRGDCTQAINAYTKAITLDPKSAENYNNRAYTYMRMKNYAAALPDLNRAIELNPNYVNALMNRGDIYNFYYKKDRQKAIADYDRVIKLGATNPRQTSVCGHRLIAMRGGMSPAIIVEILIKGYDVGCK